VGDFVQSVTNLRTPFPQLDTPLIDFGSFVDPDLEIALRFLHGCSSAQPHLRFLSITRTLLKTTFSRFGDIPNLSGELLHHLLVVSGKSLNTRMPVFFRDTGGASPVCTISSSKFQQILSDYARCTLADWKVRHH
jgi:hypothetical protein